MSDDLIPPGWSSRPEAYRPRDRRRGRRVLLGVAVLVGVVVGVPAAGAALVAHNVSMNLERFEDPFVALPARPPAPTAAPGEAAPVNLLLLGSDSRISAGDPSQWAAGAQRTDAILLVHLPADRERLYVMSIPRDSWVTIPGHGEAKINAAFSFGGPALLVQTVEQLTGVRVEHVAVTDFESFARLTDHLGGVTITTSGPTFDSHRRAMMPAGTYEMDGAQALDYVRQRSGLPRGDLDRVQRQQNWIRSIVATIADRDVLENPYELVRLLDVLSGSIAADESLTLNRMRELALSARSMDPRGVVFLTAPIVGLGTSADRQSIVVLDVERLAAVSAAIANDEMSEFLAEHPGHLETLGDNVR